MRSSHKLILTLGSILLLGFIATTVIADTVICQPVVYNRRIARLCFQVCNTPEDHCIERGCIYDVHLIFPGQQPQCLFTGVRSVPKGWIATPTNFPAPKVVFVTPDPQGGKPRPIHPCQWRTFCVKILPDCFSKPGDCIRIQWRTTDERGRTLDWGFTKCCWPAGN